jgi:hypothetical protein
MDFCLGPWSAAVAADLASHCRSARLIRTRRVSVSAVVRERCVCRFHHRLCRQAKTKTFTCYLIGSANGSAVPWRETDEEYRFRNVLRHLLEGQYSNPV